MLRRIAPKIASVWYFATSRAISSQKSNLFDFCDVSRDAILTSFVSFWGATGWGVTSQVGGNSLGTCDFDLRDFTRDFLGVASSMMLAVAILIIDNFAANTSSIYTN